MITEEESNYHGLEKMTIREILLSINKEDKTIAPVVELIVSQIEKLAEAVVEKMEEEGRLFYIGAGTSGRLGILDASECPPTYGVPFNWVVGIIAGGDTAIRRAVEFAEDNEMQGWKDLQQYEVGCKDVMVGITASGNTPYVLGALKMANGEEVVTGCITCNPGSPIAAVAKFPIEVVVGPEFVTGSSRMKAGIAQKIVLNMLTTSIMVRLGRVKGNKMVDMQFTNNKLYRRGIRMIKEETGVG